MSLVITNSIRKSELEPLEKNFPFEVIKIAASKALQGLGDEIKSSVRIPSSCLKKLYLTGKGGAGRAIFLLKINPAKIILIMLRAKNDKQIGANMTIKNPKFAKVLEKNIDTIFDELKYGNYTEYAI